MCAGVIGVGDGFVNEDEMAVVIKGGGEAVAGARRDGYRRWR